MAGAAAVVVAARVAAVVRAVRRQQVLAAISQQEAHRRSGAEPRQQTIRSSGRPGVADVAADVVANSRCRWPAIRLRGAEDGTRPLCRWGLDSSISSGMRS